MPNIIKKVLANVVQPLTLEEMAIARGNIGAASADSTPCHLFLSNGIGLHNATQSVGTSWTKVGTCTFGSLALDIPPGRLKVTLDLEDLKRLYLGGAYNYSNTIRVAIVHSGAVSDGSGTEVTIDGTTCYSKNITGQSPTYSADFLSWQFQSTTKGVFSADVYMKGTSSFTLPVVTSSTNRTQGEAALATTLIQQAGNLPTDTSGNITIGAEIERIL
jgi:hypothetical protein